VPEVVEPRPAATVILVRGGRERLELLLVERTPRASFVAGAWVFPGGALEPRDGAGEAGLRAAALRELREEAAIALPDSDALALFSRWITPPDLPIRFDTWFFLARAPADAQPRPDGGEIVAARWLEPAAALDAGLKLVHPTVMTLRQLAEHDSAEQLLEHVAAGHEVRTFRPRDRHDG